MSNEAACYFGGLRAFITSPGHLRTAVNLLIAKKEGVPAVPRGKAVSLPPVKTRPLPFRNQHRMHTTRKVLVVDEEADIRQILCARVTAAGLHAIEAGSQGRSSYHRDGIVVRCLIRS